jgi:hypothetical protein
MTTSHAVRWITKDLLNPSGVSLPQTFQMTPGSSIDITFPGRVGTMTITGEPTPDVYRARWACSGSQFDGRDFDVTWVSFSDASPPGTPIMMTAIMILVP